MDRSLSLRTTLGLSGLHRLLMAAGLALVAASTAALASEPCGTGTYPFPYTDVGSVTDPFCPGIMEAYVTGISKGTTPTTFSPNDDVTRLQMTTFLKRTVDQVLTRGSRRAALNQWWVPQNSTRMQTIATGSGRSPVFCTADGQYIWTATYGAVAQIEASTGKVLNTWTGAFESWASVVAVGKVFVESNGSPGNLYVIDPTVASGVVTSYATLPGSPSGIAFDGTNLWTSNYSGSVSIIDPLSFTVNTVATGFFFPVGILYDGANIWITDQGTQTLDQLDATGTILQSIAVGAIPEHPVFDGANIWVPNAGDNSITVVQASTGNVVATITQDASNQLDFPVTATFDGERILVTNQDGGTVTVFKAADLSFIANIPIGSQPYGACSDGINFWVALVFAGDLIRF
jgi:YVTN family beta-propeller protein